MALLPGLAIAVSFFALGLVVATLYLPFRKDPADDEPHDGPRDLSSESSGVEGYRKELNLHLSELEDLIERQSLSKPRTEAPIARQPEDRSLAGGHEELLGAFRELEEQIGLLLGAPAIPAIPHRPPGLEWVDVAAAAELTPQEIDQALLWLTYDDVLQRFGPPDSIVGLSDCTISWRYDVGPRGEIAVTFMDGHVVKVWR